jgi:uncharacterized OB-fold protein
MDLVRYPRLRPACYRLEGQRCTGCKAVQFPARTVCRICRERSLEPCPLSGRGTVYSRAEALRGVPSPYIAAVVQLEEGLLVTAQLTDVDPEAAVIGLPVEMVTRRLQERGPHGDLVHGYRFRPIVPRWKAS